jgi:precorrin-3B synthase
MNPPPAVSARPAVKGWCPGALRPMPSGDGLVVRLRLTCNEAPLALAGEIADWAETLGNGQIDLSARGNLQLRGVTDATLPALTRALAEAGLTDASPEAEAVRNVLVAPLAGYDPDAPFDVRPYAQALERELAGNSKLWALPGKFGFAFDAGAFPLGPAAADVSFVATSADGFVAVLGEAALGPFPKADVVAIAGQLAEMFLALRRMPAPPRRMRDALAAFGLAPFTAATGYEAARFDPRPRRDALGVQPLGEGAFVGLALPFGRIAAAELRALAGLAAEAGATGLRLTPWRAILVPGLTPPAAQALAEAASRLDLILDPADPRLAVAACPGAPACSSGLGSTRDVALRLAPLLAGAEGVVLHVSGCAKGCAHPAPARFAVVATAAGYDLIANGRADEVPLISGLALEALETRFKERLA